MAEEAKVESQETEQPVAVEAETAGDSAETEKKPSKSFEERLAELRKPEPVPQPDQDKVNEKLSKLNAQIEKCEKRLTEIKAALEKANSLRDGSKSESKAIVEQLKAIRAKIKAASSEREAAFQQLRELTSNRQAQQKNLQDLRRSLKYDDVAQVEARVKELEAQIETGQCTNLAHEKRVMQEIKSLNATKTMILQYQSQRSQVVDDADAKAALEQRKAEATARLDQAKKEAESLEKALDALRGKQQDKGPNVGELWKEQKELYSQIKEHRAEIRKVNNEFKEEVNKWKDFQRAMNGYKRAKDRIMNDQRRAELAKRREEAEGPIDADLPSDNPLIGHPWADEILQCQDLEKVLSSFLPKDSKEESGDASEAAKASPGELTLNNKGVYEGGKNANLDDDMFGSLVVKKKKSKGKANTDSARITLTLDTISTLGAIGVAIPTKVADVAACIDKVKEKKKAFEVMTEEDKKAAKAKAGNAGNKKGGKGDRADKSSSDKDELVNVDISAKGADKVQVKIDYPPLSVGA